MDKNQQGCLSDLSEALASWIEARYLVRVALPTPYDHIHVFGIDFDQARTASGPFRAALEPIAFHTAQLPVFANSTAILLGAKDYLPPDGLGPVVSTKCYIVVLREGNTVDISKYFDKPPMTSTRGAPTWTWSADLEEFGDRKTRLSTLYATQIGRDYIVVSNNLDQLGGVSQRLVSPENHATLSGIREWSAVSRHEFWGYRKYRRNRLLDAETIFTGTRGINSDAEALVLYVDFQQKTGVLRVLGSPTEDTTAKSLNAMWEIPPLKHAGLGDWETKFPLDATGPFPESAFQVLWLFGFGVAV